MWRQYQLKRPSRQQIETWFSDEQNHNIAIICGAVSGNLIVLDFDNNACFKQFLRKNPDIISKTPVVKTGRGYHVYLQGKQLIPSEDLPGVVEVRSEGRIVIAPPSIHPKTQRNYYFIDPDIKVPMTINGLSEVGIETDRLRAEVIPSGRLFIKPEVIRPRYAREPVSKGERNNRAFRVACYFFKHYPRDRAEVKITEWARVYCKNFPDESFTEKSLKATMDSAYKTVIGGE